MPIAYLDVPDSIQNADKRKLVKRIYDALPEAYPFPDDVRIFIREWPSERVSQDGQLGSEPARPVFMIHVPRFCTQWLFLNPRSTSQFVPFRACSETGHSVYDATKIYFVQNHAQRV